MQLVHYHPRLPSYTGKPSGKKTNKTKIYIQTTCKRYILYFFVKNYNTINNYMFNLKKNDFMKTKLLLLFAVIFMTNVSFGQFSFGVSPGINLNSAYFGYKINNKIVPYVGLQYLNAKYKYVNSKFIIPNFSQK